MMDEQRTTAELCARLSLLAYEGQKEVVAACEDIGLDRVAWFEQDDTQAFIARSRYPDPPVIVVAFRGTESARDAMTDADARRVRGPFGGSVHRGFKRGLSVVWPAMIEHFEHAVAEHGAASTVLLTGHSLGAALATLAAAELAERGLKVSGLYTFGSPRVGDWRFARALEGWLGADRIFRTVNNNDVVTRVPPWFTGYRHVGAPRYLTTDGRLLYAPPWWSVLWDRLRGRWAHFGKPGTDGLSDHRMQGYVAALEAMKEE